MHFMKEYDKNSLSIYFLLYTVLFFSIWESEFKLHQVLIVWNIDKNDNAYK